MVIQFNEYFHATGRRLLSLGLYDKNKIVKFGLFQILQQLTG